MGSIHIGRIGGDIPGSARRALSQKASNLTSLARPGPAGHITHLHLRPARVIKYLARALFYLLFCCWGATYWFTTGVKHYQEWSQLTVRRQSEFVFFLVS